LHDDLFINKSNFNLFPEIYNKILFKIKSKKDEYFISNRYNNIGTLYLALKYLEQSENIKKESHEKTLCNIGCFYREKQKHGLTLKNLEKASKIYQ
jgi:hypothetical protein